MTELLAGRQRLLVAVLAVMGLGAVLAAVLGFARDSGQHDASERGVTQSSPTQSPATPSASAGTSPMRTASRGTGAVGNAPASALALQGFGAGTTGGSGGRVATVTSLADSGPGTLRDALGQPGPTWVLFGVSGVITLDDPIPVPSDVTVDGRGADVTLSGKGLLVDGTHNVIVENLKFAAIRGSTADAIGLRNDASHVWIDHSSFSDGQDGLVDITYGATDVTVSWCHFFHHDKVMLISVLKGQGAMHVTVHHNWFDGTRQRNPLVRDAYAHVYDNVLDDWTAYGMQAQTGGYLLAQANVLRAAPGSTATEGIRVRDGRFGDGIVRAQGDWLLDGATQEEVLPGDVPSVTYAYTLQPAGPALLHEVTAGAGWQPYRASPRPRALP